MRFRVIKYRRKNEFKFAVVRKRWFRADILVAQTEREELANAICDCLNRREPLETLLSGGA